MKGSILGHGFISGEDGKRYEYGLEDLKNLGDRNPMKLENTEVDFEISEQGRAINIFIIKASNTSLASAAKNIKGKVLGNGYISGDDGERYNYHPSEIQNLQGRDPQALSGVSVDFEASTDENGKKVAKAIFITMGAMLKFDFTNINSNDIMGVRLKMLISMFLCLLTWIPFVGFLFFIISIILEFISISRLNQLAGSQTLFRNWIISMLISVFGGGVVAIIAFFGVGIGIMSGSLGGASAAGIIFTIVAGIAVAIFWFKYTYNYFNELSELSGKRLFFYAFCTKIAAVLLCLTLVGFIIAVPLYYISIILIVAAWWQFREIHTSSYQRAETN